MITKSLEMEVFYLVFNLRVCLRNLQENTGPASPPLRRSP